MIQEFSQFRPIWEECRVWFLNRIGKYSLKVLGFYQDRFLIKFSKSSHFHSDFLLLEGLKELQISIPHPISLLLRFIWSRKSSLLLLIWSIKASAQFPLCQIGRLNRFFSLQLLIRYDHRMLDRMRLHQIRVTHWSTQLLISNRQDTEKFLIQFDQYPSQVQTSDYKEVTVKCNVRLWIKSLELYCWSSWC